MSHNDWLLWLNFLVLQWFCVRLARVMANGEQTGWTFIIRLPMTGWIYS
jgi:hypothetical protein